MTLSSTVAALKLTARRFTDRAIQVMVVAREEAASRHHRSVNPAHVLLGLTLVQPGPGRVALERLGLDLDSEKASVAALLSEDIANENATFDAECDRLLAAAVSHARTLGHNYVGTEHLAMALCEANPTAEFLLAHGVTLDRLRQAVHEVLDGP